MPSLKINKKVSGAVTSDAIIYLHIKLIMPAIHFSTTHIIRTF